MKTYPRVATIVGLALYVSAASLGENNNQSADSLVPASERQAMLSLVDKLVQLGLPDTAGGEYFVGNALVQQRLDPGKESPVVPTKYSRIQETVPGSSEIVYRFIVPGPHFRLADGTWLVSLGYRVTPSDRIQVFERQVEKRELGNLLQDATEEHPFEADADFDDWFANVATENLETMKRGVAQGVPLWQYLELPRNNTTLGVCLLLRAGASDVDVLTYTIADTRCRDYWRMQPWTQPPLPLDPTEQYVGYETAEKSWDETSKPYAVEPLSVAFRRDLHRYFFHMLMQPNRPLPAELNAKLAHATLDKDDPQQRGIHVDALLESVRLASPTEAIADFATQIQAWGILEQRMAVRNVGTDNQPAIATELGIASTAYHPTQEHLPDLIALLDDDRPSRWIDYQGSRTVGENAIRAIAVALRKDPIEMVGHDATAPWTVEYRREVNKSLRSWWEQNRAQFSSPSD